MGRHRHPGDEEPVRTDPPPAERWDADHRRGAPAGSRSAGRTGRAEPYWPDRSEPNRHGGNRSRPDRSEPDRRDHGHPVVSRSAPDPRDLGRSLPDRSLPSQIERGREIERYRSVDRRPEVGRRSRTNDGDRAGARRARVPRTGDGRPDTGDTGGDESVGWTTIVLAGQIGLASVCGLLIWLGFRALWERSALTVLAALGFAAAAVYGQHLVHRRRHPDEPPDLVSLLVIAVVALVLAVTPAAFVPG